MYFSILLLKSLLYHFQNSSYKRRPVSSHSICTISYYKLFLFKLTIFRNPQLVAPWWKAVPYETLDGIIYSLHCLINLAFSYLHWTNFCCSNPTTGSDVSVRLRLVLAYIIWSVCDRQVVFAAVIRAVTQYSSPTNGYSLELCIPFLNKSLVLSNELITVELPPWKIYGYMNLWIN